MAGIRSYGAYIPYNRLPRSEIGKAWGGYAVPGERAVASYDEDSLTMGVEAALDCIKGTINVGEIDGLYFATTTPPYYEKQSASMIAQVLNLKSDACTMDFGGSLRSGANALKAAVDAVNCGSAKNVLVCASDVRMAYPKGEDEKIFGDGAAALLISNDDVLAEFEGGHSRYHELLDVWRSNQDCYVRSWEEGFIYAKGYSTIVAETIASALKKYDMSPEKFSRIALYSPNARQLGVVANKTGFDLKNQIQDVLHAGIGNTGTAMPMMSLVAVLEEAKPGEKILLAAYGDGCDVFILGVTENISKFAERRGIKGHLQSKRTLASYNKYLLWRDEVNTAPPRRVPLERPSSAAMLRDNKSGLSFFGVKCNNCGTVQYPPQRVCLNCREKDKFEEYCFMDKVGKIMAFSHDELGVSLDPPITGATVDFIGGGRIKMDITDRDPEKVTVGMNVEMTFRKLRFVRGTYGYWWKCRPLRS